MFLDRIVSQTRIDLEQRKLIVPLEEQQRLDKVRGTVTEYLADFILRDRPVTIAHWVPDDMYQPIAAAARQHGTGRLKPIYLALGEKVIEEARQCAS